MENFAYLNQSGCFSVDGFDEVREHKSLLTSMEILGFSPEERDTIFRIVAGILHLGNTQFKGDEQAKIVSMDPLEKAASCLKISAESLRLGIVSPTVKIGNKGETVRRGMTPFLAERSRDALAMALYGRLFLWIVHKINQTLQVKSKDVFIGILDIAGFEIFKVRPMNFYAYSCRKTVLNNSASTSQMKGCNNFLTITCFTWNKRSTRERRLSGISLTSEWILKPQLI